MTDLVTERPPFAGHGAASLISVVIDSYNEELRDGDGFMGDRANKRAEKQRDEAAPAARAHFCLRLLQHAQNWK